MEEPNAKPKRDFSGNNDGNRPEKRSFQLKRPAEGNNYNKRSYNSNYSNDRKQSDHRGGENRSYNSTSRNNEGRREYGNNSYGNRYGNEGRSYNNQGRSYGGERKNYGNSDSRFGNERRNNYGTPNGNRSYNSNRYESNSPRRPYQQQDSTHYDENNKKIVFRKRKKVGENTERKHFEAYKEEVDLTKPIRLNKFLANAGICSRREADEFIQAGVISVNDVIVTELGTKILPTDRVLFHDQLVHSERKIYLILNKPKDFVTTAEDTHDRKIVMDLVKNACSERIYPVGRLDRNTTGVLLFTNDGDLAAKLTHPKYEKKKIYHATLDKELQDADFEQILKGVELDDGIIAADDLAFVKEDSRLQVGIEIHSGKNRVVRRIFDKLGYKVTKLDRVYFAGLTKKNLPRGRYRFLTGKEIAALKMGAYE